MSAISERAIANRKQYFRNWYLTNKPRIQALSKINYAKNRERILARQKEKNTQRPNRYKRIYGISIADYDRLFAQQHGRCAICGTKEIDRNGRRKYFCVDHCHKSGSVRGLLCVACNVLLGQYELKRQAMAAYLGES